VRAVITQASQTIYFDDFYASVGSARPYGTWDNLKQQEIEPQGATTLTFSATPTIYGDVSTMQSMTLTSNVTAVVFANMLPGLPVLLKLSQDGTGGRTLPAAGSWTVSGGTVRFVAGTAPTLTSTASRSDLYQALYDGTDVWVSVVSQNFT